MVVDRRGTHEAQTELIGDGPRLDVEVVEHLDVVADEADRHHDDVPHAALRQRAERLADVGLEPRVARVAAAALVGNRPARVAEALGNGAGAGLDLRDVRRPGRHRCRDAVGGEDHLPRTAAVGRDLLQRRRVPAVMASTNKG